MSSSAESFVVDRPRRVWKIVAAVAVGIVALPVALGVAGWASNELGTPSSGSVQPTRVKN